MADPNLTQSEANTLIAMAKRCVNNAEWDFPDLGGKVSIPLVSYDQREHFMLDLTRGRIDLAKCTYQNRARQVVILLRLDIGGPPHSNPDGQDVPTPHLHIYREGYADKWAFPVPENQFTNLSDAWQTLIEFMLFCTIEEPPTIRRGLFT